MVMLGCNFSDFRGETFEREKASDLWKLNSTLEAQFYTDNKPSR